MFRTYEEWEEILNESELEALCDYNMTEGQISSNKVFETIVNWNGGLATAYEAKSIISRVYGIELE